MKKLFKKKFGKNFFYLDVKKYKKKPIELAVCSDEEDSSKESIIFKKEN